MAPSGSGKPGAAEARMACALRARMAVFDSGRPVRFDGRPSSTPVSDRGRECWCQFGRRSRIEVHGGRILERHDQQLRQLGVMIGLMGRDGIRPGSGRIGFRCRKQPVRRKPG